MGDEVTNLDQMEGANAAKKAKGEKVNVKNQIRNNMDLKLFRCKNCSSEKDGQVWWSWNEAIKQDPNNDRTLLLCPTCEQTLGIYSLDNECDLSFKPKNLKQNLKAGK